MNENKARDIYLKLASITLDELSDNERAGFNMCLALGNDPRKLPQWDKLKPLYRIERDPPTMHSEIERAICILLNK